MSDQPPPHLPTAFGNYQNDIYLRALGGVLPDLPMTYAELEARAAEAMPPSLVSYVAGGAGDEATQRANVEAFARWGLYPRMFVGARERDLSVELFGRTWPSPLFMAPIGVIGLCAQDGHGDLATARAAVRTGVPMIASTLSVDPLEDVAAELGSAPGFFQLYTPTDRDLAESLVRRAEKAGYTAIVVTLDTWVTGWRPRDLATGNFPQLRGHCLANYFTDPVFHRLLGKHPQDDPQGAILLWTRLFGNALTWDDLAWLRSLTRLPLIVKGICHPDDVRRAKDGGVDAVYCSNHGGRQANGGLPALAVLPDVVAAADGLPVLFDSGVRSGADLVKALALGATAVGIGRPYAYGCALGGTDGIVHVLKTVLAEADLIMAVDGYPTRADLTPGSLRLLP
ncbi:alpha-hydroxy-acid oxidizing protein [Streptomyces cocklensis]|jgi:lactate 2-monooxygenase|uniref:Lactate 2-monooxygenase n=1 Tax=Actinacidiphila cocklensis TaxID=887465 RepID=A0A9W4GN56_9ACTN|nr:alpha-hydroxy-acid oxidizing protein [Actinacidiphila cocklensis]MDD1063597.1 alpha-hydroxy-acid oxidizing protein [Actinacidiphila cocklensis]WSX72979.1 alpha-hydroxy-acid oxidizing protein [Streptomyces sp. NBC_00899]WSX80954.1 alpha-hydroxy-acid oxidizing protein [Streptomyces sp. NBC_00899]CAG6390986.1 Lactate 2-monooxygenase [Actinacidiphila cocklensis]